MMRTCPNCGNCHEAAAKPSELRDPIWLNRRRKGENPDETVQTFECWACFHEFEVTDHPLWERPAYSILGRAYHGRT